MFTLSRPARSRPAVLIGLALISLALIGVVGVPPSMGHGVKYNVATFVLEGDATGVAWAWRIECATLPASFDPVSTEIDGVPSGTALDVGNVFAASILSESIADNPDGPWLLAAAADKAGMTLLTVYSTDDTALNLFVGPAGAPAASLVGHSPVQFNPTIARLNLSGLDCNANGWDDAIDFLVGEARDVNGNGIADECDLLNCPGDVTLDGIVNQADLGAVLSNFGCCGEVLWQCPGDVNLDMKVDQADVGIVLSRVGTNCN